MGGRNNSSKGRGGRGRGKKDHESSENNDAKDQATKAIDLVFQIGDASHASNYFKLAEAIESFQP